MQPTVIGSERRGKHIRILDICSGSGCISLLLQSLVSYHRFTLQTVGMDISKETVTLAKENLARNVKKGHLPRLLISSEFPTYRAAKFIVGDALSGPLLTGRFDIIISNPPYISGRKFDTETTRSVRNWEPRLALVPPISEQLPPACPDSEDIFYYRLIQLHSEYNSKVLLMEVGDEEQAVRVTRMILKMNLAYRYRVEIWRDWPDQDQDSRELRRLRVGDYFIPVKGSGKIRSVLLFREKVVPSRSIWSSTSQVDSEEPLHGQKDIRQFNGWAVMPLPT